MRKFALGLIAAACIGGHAQAGLDPIPINYTVDTSADSGAGSLRSALSAAGRDGVPSVIQFVPPSGPGSGIGIVVETQLPDVPSDTTLDATALLSPSGSPGASLSGDTHSVPIGLNVVGSNVSIIGLRIRFFTEADIRITSAGGVHVGRCVLGVRQGQTTTSDHAVVIDGPGTAATPGHLIGGFASNEGNTIGNIDGDAIFIRGVSNVRILNNRIGTDLSGMNQRFNKGAGIDIQGNGHSISNNLISGNAAEAIVLSGSLATIQGNIIGLLADGITPLGNAENQFPHPAAVRILGSNNQIGGASPETRNVISANELHGIHIGSPTDACTANSVQGNYIGTDSTGTVNRGNGGDGIFLEGIASSGDVGGFGTGHGNLISANTGAGIRISGAEARFNDIFGNTIGTDVSGLTADHASGPLGNAVGVALENGATRNRVGGPFSSTRNLISGNGVQITLTGAVENSIQANYIGTDRTGMAAMPSTVAGTHNGIEGTEERENTIGGTLPGMANVISGNVIGVSLAGNGNVIQGNLIGVAADGSTPLPNAQGVVIRADTQTGGVGNEIGGATPGARNVISGNTFEGVSLQGQFKNLGTLVRGNYIGTDVSGLHAVPNSDGVSLLGIQCEIGGLSASAGNLISGNSRDGINVIGGTQNLILENTIGLDASGQPLGNGRIGVEVLNPSDRCRIQGNRIFANGRLGIDLLTFGSTGVNPNDVPDVEVGANQGQNYPVITKAVIGDTREDGIFGSLDSAPNTTFEIELFLSPGVDQQTGFGEGHTLFAHFSVTTDATGHEDWHRNMLSAPPGRFITATATDPDGNTSEFSEAFPIANRTFSVEEIILALLGVTGVRPEYDTNIDATLDAADLTTQIGPL